jgi:hypothetical protein
MPIPALDATGFLAREDSQFFKEAPADPAMRKEIEGGFAITRPRYTRAPPITFTTGWTDISDADKKRLMTFYANQRGGSNSFDYVHPIDGHTVQVRFVGKVEPEYAGFGGNHRWNIKNVTLEIV